MRDDRSWSVKNKIRVCLYKYHRPENYCEEKVLFLFLSLSLLFGTVERAASIFIIIVALGLAQVKN